MDKVMKPTLFDAYQHHNWRKSKTCGTLTTAGGSVRGDTPLVLYEEEEETDGDDNNESA